MEKKQKNTSNSNSNTNNGSNSNANNNWNISSTNNNPNIQKLIFSKEDIYLENDPEIEEFKRKITNDSIPAGHIIKIKPYFSKRWLEEIK